jgi:hypothetical protein
MACGGACKLLLCGGRFYAEAAIANGLAQLNGMSTPDINSLILSKFNSQAEYDATVAGLEAGIAALKKVNEVLMA